MAASSARSFSAGPRILCPRLPGMWPFGSARTNTREKPGCKCKWRRCARQLRSNHEPNDRAPIVSEIDWIPRPRITQLRRLGLETVGDLLTHYPRRHEDRREFAGFPREESEQPICLCGEVVKTRFNRFGRGKRIFEATLQEDGAHALSQPLVLRWFNLHYVQKMILSGQRLVVFGKPRQRGQRLCMEHPEFEVIENDEEISIHFRRITPIYPATEGLSQRVLRSLIYRLLEECQNDDLTTLLPAGLSAATRGRSMARDPLSPDGRSARAALARRLSWGSFSRCKCCSPRAAPAFERGRAPCIAAGENCWSAFCARLPFDLTSAQARVIEELRADLCSTFPMNRLLQGDVGSGKTVVAVAAMLLAVEAGFQAALMAPTQILAEQHYAVLRRWLEPLGVPVSLRTGARKEDPLPLFANASAQLPGSARVSRAGDGVSPSRTFLEREQSDGAHYHRRRLPHFEKPWAIYAVTIGTKSRRCLSPEARTVVLDALRHFHKRALRIVRRLRHARSRPRADPALAQRGRRKRKRHLLVFERTVAIGEIFFRPRNQSAGRHRTGGVWERERFDRYIRSDRDLEEKFHYILRNPWEFGDCWAKRRLSLALDAGR